MQVDIEALKAAAMAAIPGPWDCTGKQFTDSGVAYFEVMDSVRNNEIVGEYGADQTTCRYIAAANPAAILALIAELEQLRADKAKPVEQEPVIWYEAEESARGADVRDVIGGMIYSTRLHTAKPDTKNPVWPLYAAPQAPVAAVQGKALVPEGWKLVPIKSTPKMIDATWDIMVRHVSENKRNRIIWDAMIAAAPEPK